MKTKHLLIAIMCLFVQLSTTAQITKLQAKASIDSLIPTNNTRTITAAKIQQAFLKALSFAEPSNFADGAVTLPKISPAGGTEGQVIKKVGGVLTWGNDNSGGSTTITGLTTVANITALRSRVGVLDGEMVQTTGYYTKNDGGGWAYLWNATSTATDNGGDRIDSNGGTAGIWELAYYGFIRGRWFGMKIDGVQDDLAYLQNATDYIVQKGGKFDIGGGVVRITDTWRLGTTTPGSLPGSEKATFTGDGPAFNWTAPSTNGTVIRLDGTGKTAIVDIKAGLGRYLKLENFTVSCNTEGGASYGILWSQTGHSAHFLENVHSRRANIAIGMLQGGFANGEFITFEKCEWSAVQTGFYLPSNTGQAFNHLLLHCHGSVNDGGTLFEFGGGALGFGFTAVEFESSNPINFTTSTGVTFIKNNGISGIVNFQGGRIEGVSTLLSNILGSPNQNGKLNFSGLHFDGMGSNTTRKLLKSTGSNSRQGVNFENCIFSPIDPAAEVNISLGDTDNGEYRFTQCDFNEMAVWKVAMSETINGKLVFDNCQRKNLSTSNVMRFSKNYTFNSPSPVPSISKPQNLLLQSGFSASTGTAIASASPWVHTGFGTFYALYNNTNNIGNYSNDTKFRQAVFNVSSGVYQNVTGFTFGTGENVAYYSGLFSYHAAGGMSFQISLENSSTGKVYDQLTLKGASTNGAVIPVDLIANDGNVGGNVRVRLLNLDTNNPFYLNTFKQSVYTNPMGAYTETTTTAQDLPYVVR